MKEKKLQYELVVWFSQEYPQLRGLFFEANNDTYNVKHAMKRRSMGMISGVSDLIFVMPKTSVIVGIELKAPKSVHSKQHIQNQITWGEQIIANGGYYLITSSLTKAKNFIKWLINNHVGLAISCQDICLNFVKEQYYKKTIKF